MHLKSTDFSLCLQWHPQSAFRAVCSYSLPRFCKLWLSAFQTRITLHTAKVVQIIHTSRFAQLHDTCTFCATPAYSTACSYAVRLAHIVLCHFCIWMLKLYANTHLPCAGEGPAGRPTSRTKPWSRTRLSYVTQPW
jgi:hypothetical protein